MERISIGNVSLNFLRCVIEFQRVRVSVGRAGGFPPCAERVEGEGRRVHLVWECFFRFSLKFWRIPEGSGVRW